jgi:hypothetical protein
MAEPDDKPATPPPDAPPARMTAQQRSAAKRDQKLADVQEQIEEGRMTVRKLTPEEMEAHGKRRDEIQAERAKRKR